MRLLHSKWAKSDLRNRPESVLVMWRERGVGTNCKRDWWPCPLVTFWDSWANKLDWWESIWGKKD